MINRPDKTLLFSIFALVIFGLIMIASAGVVYSQTRFGDQYYFFKHQLFYGIIPGLIILYFFSRVDYHYWKKVGVLLFLISLVFLILVFIPGVGTKVYGANRWIQLGPLSFQPSEMMKLSMILYLAAWLESRGRVRVRDFFEGFLPFVAIVALVGFLIIKQPDTGTLGIILLTSLAIYFISGAKISHIATFIAVAFGGIITLIKIAPYRMNRILVFLNPSTDIQGIGYQINQALIAIGSGGIFGLGLGHSRQKYNYLPEPVGDSIFAIIGEELGLIGAVGVIILFTVLAFQGYKIARRSPDNFGKLVAGGITSWLIIQAFVNISSISGLIPLTGVPLPFVSYGGTSIIFLMAGMGILLNISKQAKLNS
jgi:cell division protein FtsW